VLFLGFLLFIAAEVAAFVAVGEHIGFGWAVLILLGVSALGPFVVRRVGLAVVARTRDRLARGELPTGELLDGVVVLMAGTMICVPGFIGDALGLLLMIRSVRTLLIRWIGYRLARRLENMRDIRWRVINIGVRPKPDNLASPGELPDGTPELDEGADS
jgi:UPF0716 protein FxsA